MFISVGALYVMMVREWMHGLGRLEVVMLDWAWACDWVWDALLVRLGFGMLCLGGLGLGDWHVRPWQQEYMCAHKHRMHASRPQH